MKRTMLRVVAAFAAVAAIGTWLEATNFSSGQGQDGSITAILMAACAMSVAIVLVCLYLLGLFPKISSRGRHRA